LELINENEVIGLIERIGYHYHLNIANKILRPMILQLYLDKATWKHIEVFTEKLDLYRYNGFELDDLYRKVAACARFIEAARQGIYAIKNKVRADRNAPDRTYREMIVNNLPNNLKIFSDLLNVLYMILIDYDDSKSSIRTPIYVRMPELEKVRYILTKDQL
jgi:hypothetical protein